MAKKHYYILCGHQGVIYYSWLFLLFFIGFVVAFEAGEKISWLSVVILTLFALLLFYTIRNSYYQIDATGQVSIKLPYQHKISSATFHNEPIRRMRGLGLKKIEFSQLHLQILEIDRGKRREK